MENGNAKRDNFIDAVKGIGIVSVVIGHAGWELQFGNLSVPVGTFVYLYHLAVFAFCSGYLFREPERGFWQFAGKKLKSLYLPFLVYTLLYLLFRNLFLLMGNLGNNLYSGKDLLIAVSNAFAFQGANELLGTLWFLPMLFFAVLFFAAIILLTGKIPQPCLRETLRLACFCIGGAIGLYVMMRHISLPYYMHVSWLMVPVIAGGYYFHRFDGRRCLNITGLVISFLLLAAVIRSGVGYIELTDFRIINKGLFYPVTFCGIYFCMALAKVLSKFRLPEKFFCFCGRNSLDIMALHLFSFKIIDYFACRITGRMDLAGVFPCSFAGLWPVYYAAGVAIPLLLKKLFVEGRRLVLKIYRRT